ncbi:EamA family transporter [Pseudoalteromonas ardens]|uniref:ABC transporter permease n=1 Tax=Pseudoalteromonas rubra TaxID=43658 RepID=A0A0L0EPL3_9GAMM|nr:EamA family transporter [Pseudoalteromonas sp. R96]KNC66315.1 ABC transporter permease [Pseudoalteromonas rubra]MDK1312805.1 EamA family transporter [Pseudoalteromonas sp. R96]
MSNKQLIFWMVVAMIAPTIWGSTYIVTTELLPADKPLIASVLRALPAGILLVLLGRKLPQGVWWMRSIILGLLNIGGFFYCLFVAAYLLPGGVAALVMSCQPIIVMLLGALLLKNKLKARQFVACLIGALGVSLLVLEPNMELPTAGVLAGLAGAMSMATGIVLTKKWGKPEGVSLYTFTGWQLVVGGLFLLPIGLVQEGFPTELTVNNVIGYTYLSLIGALVAYVLWFKAIEKLPVVTVSFISFASPLSATLLGYFILGEVLTFSQILGAGVIVVAIAVSQQQLFNRTLASPSTDKSLSKA